MEVKLASISAEPLKRPSVQPLIRETRRSWGETLANAWIVTRRELRDSLRDWRIIVPIVLLTFGFPFLAQFIAARFSGFVEGFGAQIIAGRTIPFLLMVVGFFPISISLVIALETFVGEKERRSLEPLLSTPLTNTELYIGKTLSAMIPPLAASYGGMFVYGASLIFGSLEWRPQAMLIVQIILLTTAQALVMVTGAVVVSSQTTSTRAANLLASFIIIPMALLIQGESAIMFLAPDAESPNGIGALWAIIVGMVIVCILLLRVGNAVFNREELLGRTLDQLNLKLAFQRIFRWMRAIDDQGTPAPNVLVWYTQGMRASLKRLGLAIGVTVFVFVAALIAGVLVGLFSEYQLALPRGVSDQTIAQNLNATTGLFFGERPVLAIFTNNLRILLAALLTGMFSFGVGALILTPAVYFIIGYIFVQIAVAGYDLAFFAPAILTHGIIEIPVIVVATAAALRLGAVVTRQVPGSTVGHTWTVALGDALKLFIGLVIPGLLLAAFIEAAITPQVVRALLGA
ncbi:MAG: stage II sporulation protein M [Candidatus Flexifilum sp.]